MTLHSEGFLHRAAKTVIASRHRYAGHIRHSGFGQRLPFAEKSLDVFATFRRRDRSFARFDIPSL